MATLYEALLIALAQLGLFTLCGAGLGWWLLPPAARPHTLTLAPVFGLALLGTLGFYTTNLGMTLTQTLPLAAGIGVVLLALALWRGWRSTDGWRLPWRELLPLTVLTFGGWLLCLLPVLNYGALTPIGHNWDVEFYLPLAEYLKRASYLTLDQVPANPLKDLVSSERIAARGMGGTYAQALADLVTRRDAWQSWVPLLALLRALTLPALYALLRAGFGARPLGALAGCALAALHPLLLWTTYNSFGMGLTGTTLLPLAVLLGALALRDWRAVPGAGFLAGALSCAYWPILQPYGAAMLGIGLAALGGRSLRSRAPLPPAAGGRSLRSRGLRSLRSLGGSAPYGRLGESSANPVPPAPERASASTGSANASGPPSGAAARVLARGLAILALGGLTGILAHVRAPQAFLGVFQLQTPSMGVSSFPSLPEVLGSAGYSHLGLSVGVAEVWLGWVGALALLALLALGVWRGTAWRAAALGMTACLALYLLGIWLVVGFPYGLLRAASYVAPLLAGMAGVGVQSLKVKVERQKSTDEQPRTQRLPLSTFNFYLLPFAVALVSAALGAYRTYAPYAAEPATYPLELAAAIRSAALLPNQGAVVVSPAAELRGPYMAGWSYALRNRRIFGATATGYQRYIRESGGAAPAYGLLTLNEDPRDYGLDPAAPVWRSQRAVLYAAPARQTGLLMGRDLAATAALDAETTLGRAQLLAGPYQVARPDAPLTFDVSPRAVTLARSIAAEVAQRGVVLTLGSHAAQPVELTTPDGVVAIALQPGVSTYRLGPLRVPAQLTLRPTKSPLFLRTVQVFDDQIGPVSTGALSDTLLLSVTPQVSGTQLAARLDVQNQSGERIRLAVEVYQDRSGFGAPAAHDSWALFAAPASGGHQLTIDLNKPAFALDKQPLPTQTGERRDGTFFVALWVYQGEQVRQVLPFATFRRAGGAISAVTPLPVNAAFVRLAPPEQPLDTRTEAGIALSGTESSAATARPGETLRVSLLWRALAQPRAEPYLVTVQLIGEADRKAAQWDGAAGGDWLPSPAWRAGERVWQDVPLTIAADAPPGDYRLIAALYDPASGARLRFADGADSVTLGAVRVEP